MERNIFTFYLLMWRGLIYKGCVSLYAYCAMPRKYGLQSSGRPK
jgi:hypothetical protein